MGMSPDGGDEGKDAAGHVSYQDPKQSSPKPAIAGAAGDLGPVVWPILATRIACQRRTRQQSIFSGAR